MKKTILLFILSSQLLFAQNSISNEPNGSTYLQKVFGFPTSTIYNGIFTSKTAQFISTGSVSSANPLTAINAVVDNSTEQNNAIVGVAGGGGFSYGVSGYATGNSGEKYGGYFGVFSNSTGYSVGITASVNSLISSNANRVGGFFGTISNTTGGSYGISAEADNSNNGYTIGGKFQANNFSLGTGDRIGIQCSASGNGSYKVGISSFANGDFTNIGSRSEASGGSTNIASWLETNSTATSFQLVLRETEDDFSRISFRNTLGEGWHQSVYRGSTAANSQFNFFSVQSGLDVLSLRGNGNATLAGTLTQLSDMRLKKNIRPIENIDEKINQINGMYYQWEDESKNQNQQIGFIAQEIEKVFPELVETDEKGYKSVAYANFSPILVEAIKKQNQKIEQLEKEMNEIKSLLKIASK